MNIYNIGIKISFNLHEILFILAPRVHSTGERVLYSRTNLVENICLYKVLLENTFLFSTVWYASESVY